MAVPISRIPEVQTTAEETSESSREWIVAQEGFDPSEERRLETLFCIGNGYLGVRGALTLPIPTSQADLFVAGVFGPHLKSAGHATVEHGGEETYLDMPAFPSPFRLKLSVGGTTYRTGDRYMTSHERSLSLLSGILTEKFAFTDELGRTTELTARRLTHALAPHLLLHEIEILCKNHSSEIDLDLSAIPGDFATSYPGVKVLPTPKPAQLSELHLFEVQGTSFKVCLASRTIHESQERHDPYYRFHACEARPIRIRQMIAIFTSREAPNPEEATRRHLRERRWEEFDREISRHQSQWESFWKVADIYLPKRPDLSQALRFNLYQLRIAANHDPTISIGARALTGRAYEGHVFWDTDVFMLPFFLYTAPAIAKNLLLYRYHTLPGARCRAREAGLRGAWYAWESTVSGADATPKTIFIEATHQQIPVFSGPNQIHISADVAYAVHRYYEVTRDEEFLKSHGAEILVETARFWASRVTEKEGKFHLLRVMGPDEYHFEVDDDAYTNWMARFNLEKARWVTNWLKAFPKGEWDDFQNRLQLKECEITRWEEIAGNLFIPQPDSNGVIEQFRGFFDLKPPSPVNQEALGSSLVKLFQWEELNRLRIVKQADVLMIPFLFPDAFPEAILKANYDYYEPITDHGSSLSPPVHAGIAARLWIEKDAVHYLETSLVTDLEDRLGNTALGFHAATAGGIWQALVFHFLGVSDQGESLELPKKRWFSWLGGASFQLRHRGKLVRFRISSGGAE